MKTKFKQQNECEHVWGKKACTEKCLEESEKFLEGYEGCIFHSFNPLHCVICDRTKRDHDFWSENYCELKKEGKL